ncbi:MAG: SDR family NAD(P)-dependent oxidoreductase, partial [Steroidobacteraceae bacterium]
MNLQGKKIVITGAFGALGSSVAAAVQTAGASVACIDSASAPATALPRSIVLGGVDLSSAAAANTALQEAAEKLGGLDGLVNIAGTFRWETLEGGSTETWDMLYNVNVRTAVNATRAALSKLNKGGRILNIGAAGAIKAGAGMGAYAASKSGVAKLTEALADELKDRDITVNAVLPSIIDTPVNRADMPDAQFDRWVKAEQVADLIVFLLS